MPKALGHRWTKVVIRKLPPTLQEQAFRDALEKVCGEDASAWRWIIFCPGKQSNKRTMDTRAYINFSEPQKVLEFKAKFHGHVFVSARGTQYRCSVEYAPFQKIPRNRNKRDPREGTIENDKDYQKFVEELEKPPERLPSAATQLERERAEKEAEKDKKEGGEDFITTPLMEYVVNKHLTKGRKGAQNKGGSKGTSHQKDEEKDKKTSSSPPSHRARQSSGQSGNPDTHHTGKASHGNRKDGVDGGKWAQARGTRPTVAEASPTSSLPKGRGKDGKTRSLSSADLQSKEEKSGNQSGRKKGSHDNQSDANNTVPVVENAPKVRLREGHQPYVPRVLKTRVSALDADADEIDNDYNRNIPVNATIEDDDKVTHRPRGRGRRRPDGRRGGGPSSDGWKGSNPSGAWNSVPDDNGGEEGYEDLGAGDSGHSRRRYSKRGGRSAGRRGGLTGGRGQGKSIWIPVKKDA